MTLRKCGECRNEIISEVKQCAHCDAEKKEISFIKILGIGLGGIVLLAIMGNITSVNKNNANAAILPSSEISIPTEQYNFIKTVEFFIAKYKEAPNELQKSQLREQRKVAIANFLSTNLGGMTFNGWVGRLKDMGTNSQRKAYVEIEFLNSKISVKTWSIALADIRDNTLIPLGSNVYQKLSVMSKGDIVVFSGTFLPGNDDYIRERSLTEAGSMLEPEFIVRFFDISQYEVQKTTKIDAQTVSSPEPEAIMWTLVEQSSNPEDIRDFLKAYPDGRFAPAARLKLKQLERQQARETTSAPSQPTVAKPPGVPHGGGTQGAVALPVAQDAMTLLQQMITLAKNNGGQGQEAQIEALKQQIEALPKPARGDRKTARLHNDKGLDACKKEQYEQALQHFIKAYQLDPGDVEVANNVGFAYIKTGNLQEAIRYLGIALSIAPGRAAAWSNMAEVYAQSGRMEEAVAAYALTFRFSKAQDNTRRFLEQQVASADHPQIVEAAKQALALSLISGGTESSKPPR